jgi:hypothetical protein
MCWPPEYLDSRGDPRRRTTCPRPKIATEPEIIEGRNDAMASFTVRVVDDDDEGIAGVRVGLEFTSITRGMAHEYTDSDGRAEFGDYDEGEVNVFLNGQNYGTCEYVDGDEITITK